MKTRIAIFCLIVGCMLAVLPKHAAAVTHIGPPTNPPPATPNQ